MSDRENSALALVNLLARKAPAYLDLFTAENDADFENAFDALLEKAVSGLEMNKKKFKTLDEEGLTGALALALSTPGLNVTQETHSNGHELLLVHLKPGYGFFQKGI